MDWLRERYTDCPCRSGHWEIDLFGEGGSPHHLPSLLFLCTPVEMLSACNWQRRFWRYIEMNLPEGTCKDVSGKPRSPSFQTSKLSDYFFGMFVTVPDVQFRTLMHVAAKLMSSVRARGSGFYVELLYKGALLASGTRRRTISPLFLQLPRVASPICSWTG